jgi:hypothetical protein
VLEHVVDDDEINAAVLEGGQRAGIIDHVDLGDRRGVQPERDRAWAFFAQQPRSIEPVDVANPHARWHAQGRGERADLNPITGQVTPSEVFTNDPRVITMQAQDDVADAPVGAAAHHADPAASDGAAGCPSDETHRPACKHGPRAGPAISRQGAEMARRAAGQVIECRARRSPRGSPGSAVGQARGTAPTLLSFR